MGIFSVKSGILLQKSDRKRKLRKKIFLTLKSWPKSTDSILSWHQKCVSTLFITKCKAKNWTSMRKIISCINWVINSELKLTITIICKSSKRTSFFCFIFPKKPKWSSPNDFNVNFSLPMSPFINFAARKNCGLWPKENFRFTLIADKEWGSIARRNSRKSWRSIRKRSQTIFLDTRVSFVANQQISERSRKTLLWFTIWKKASYWKW